MKYYPNRKFIEYGGILPNDLILNLENAFIFY